MHRNFVESTPFSMVSRANESSRKVLSESTVNTIWQLNLYGVSGAAIGRHLGVPKSTAHYNIRRLRKQSQDVYTKALPTGRPLKLNKRAKRHLVRYITFTEGQSGSQK